MVYRTAAKFLSSCLLLACGGLEPGAPEEGNYQPGSTPTAAPAPATAAHAISALQAEGSAVAHALAMGSLDAAAARASTVTSLLAVDLEGAPAFHLVFLSTDASIATPWTFASKAGGTFAMVGARDDQPEVGMSADTLTTLDDMQRTLAALGGIAQLDAIVTPVAGVILLRDRSGAHWDVDTHAVVDAETFTQRRADYAAAGASDEDGERAEARTIWASRLEGTSPVDVNALAREGHLDLGRVFAAVTLPDTLQIPVATPAEAERNEIFEKHDEDCITYWFFGKHRKCDHVEEGRLAVPTLSQGHYPHQWNGFSAPRCVGGARPRDEDSLLGCGPAAVISLVWRSWRNGGAYPALAGLDRAAAEPHDTNPESAQYETFSRLLGQDLMDGMATCSFGADGAMTLPDGLVNGTNRWFSSQGRPERMKMVRGGKRKDKARALHNVMGIRELPVLAGFDLGFVSSHWSPVSRYRIVDEKLSPWGPKVYVQSIDHQDRWYELFGVKLVKAVAWLAE